MKALALISDSHDATTINWQFDRVMAAIAYDVELIVVFMNRGYTQLLTSDIWKCLNIYGADEIYYLENESPDFKYPDSSYEIIDHEQLKNMIAYSDIFL